MSLTSKPKTCSVCGRVFYLSVGSGYLYKIRKPKTEYQCSYSCWCKAKATIAAKDRASYRREKG